MKRLVAIFAILSVLSYLILGVSIGKFDESITGGTYTYEGKLL
ncbi:unnamed protein product, partial [marine sediment metagenome]